MNPRSASSSASAEECCRASRWARRSPTAWRSAAAFGLVFGILFARRATSAGAGLIWGLAAAFLMWLVFPAGLLPLFTRGAHSMAALGDTRDQFPLLVGYLVCLGMPVGLVLGIRGGLRSNTADTQFNWTRAMVAGGLAGLLGGFIFDRWMSAGEFFPLLSGLSELPSRTSSLTLQFFIAVLMGVIFGLLFQRDVRSYGSCMGWGVGYAITVVVPRPADDFARCCRALRSTGPSENGSAMFGALVGHILYGLILGVSYATLDKIWVRLFIQSDPLNREAHGPGLRVLQSLGWGTLAGFAGGIVSSPIMLKTGVLTKVAGLDTSFTNWHGLLVHLLVSALIGMTFGLLFRNESSNLGAGVAWGWLFGLIWWYLGPMTLLPLLADGRLRLEHRRSFRAVALADGAPDLRRRDRVRLPAAGAIATLVGCCWIHASPCVNSVGCDRWERPRRHFGFWFWASAFCCQFCWTKKPVAQAWPARSVKSSARPVDERLRH